MVSINPKHCLVVALVLNVLATGRHDDEKKRETHTVYQNDIDTGHKALCPVSYLVWRNEQCPLVASQRAQKFSLVSHSSSPMLIDASQIFCHSVVFNRPGLPDNPWDMYITACTFGLVYSHVSTKPRPEARNVNLFFMPAR